MTILAYFGYPSPATAPRPRQMPMRDRTTGEIVRVLGEPFQLDLPLAPGARQIPSPTWLTAVYPDGKARPLNVDDAQPLQVGASA